MAIFPFLHHLSASLNTFTRTIIFDISDSVIKIVDAIAQGTEFLTDLAAFTKAYIAGFPLIMIDATRQLAQRDTLNHFVNQEKFPDATSTNVVRQNNDTLYSSLFYNVEASPLIIHIPDTQGRYDLFPILDAWSNVIASPGARTTRTQAQTFAITGPNWQGTLPAGITAISSPTNEGWIIGRIESKGPQDYDAVHSLQNQLYSEPLISWAKDQGHSAVAAPISLQSQSSKSPLQDVLALSPTTYFSRLASLLQNTPLVPSDPYLAKTLTVVGLNKGDKFDATALNTTAQRALSVAPFVAQALMNAEGVKLILDQGVQNPSPLQYAENIFSLIRNIATGRNWLTIPDLGNYGTDYLKRMLIAYSGLGANTREDSIYYSMSLPASAHGYNVHFDANALPPVNAFWSLTAYNQAQNFIANPLNRYELGSHDPLHYNADHSLDLYLQPTAPLLTQQQHNWLPLPANENTSLTLRLYWPQQAALDNQWVPPSVHAL